MSPFKSLSELLGGRSGKLVGTPQLQLPDSVVTHDAVDEYLFRSFADESPRFRRLTVTDRPRISPDVPDPDPIDFTSASPDEIQTWQEAAREAKAAREEAPEYLAWEKLTRDVFYSYHTHDRPSVREDVDPSVALHSRIMPKLTNTDDHAQSRNMTRDDKIAAGMATMACVRTLREILGDELLDQARQQQEYNQHAQNAEQAYDELSDLRDLAQSLHEQGQAIPQQLRDRIKQAVQDKRQAQQAAATAADAQTPIDLQGMTAIAEAAAAGQQAAENAGNLPSFGAGFGRGEPTYESPEQALAIAEAWANNPQLRQMAELFGRLDRDIKFQRSKRVVGGNDEIVDVKMGNDLTRVVPSELSMLVLDEFEDDFFMRYAAEELLIYSTEGEEHAGRGPIAVVLDGSYSMVGERNIWSRAVVMCLLNIARREKRGFYCVEFADARETESWEFPAKGPMDGQRVLDMASHFFGGGTSPIQGVAAAAKFMQDSPEFKKADLVMIGDGEAGFGPEDKRLRDGLTALGVRIFGIAIGSDSSFKYLEQYCESLVHVSEFDLTDPSAATAELATHIT